MFSYVGLFSAAICPSKTSKIIYPEVYADRRSKIMQLFEMGVKLYYMAIGVEDFLYDENEKFRAELDADSIPYVYKESRFGHEWSNWRRYLEDYLPRLFR